jgi:hypothetical protein
MQLFDEKPNRVCQIVWVANQPFKRGHGFKWEQDSLHWCSTHLYLRWDEHWCTVIGEPLLGVAPPKHAISVECHSADSFTYQLL